MAREKKREFEILTGLGGLLTLLLVGFVLVPNLRLILFSVAIIAVVSSILVNAGLALADWIGQRTHQPAPVHVDASVQKRSSAYSGQS